LNEVVMVDKTKFEIIDTDHDPRLAEDDLPYCLECGEDERLAFLYNYSNGGEWKCKVCGGIFMWAEVENDY